MPNNIRKRFQFRRAGHRFARRTNQLRQASSHFNWAIGDQAVVSGANFGISILLARLLGVEEFGKYVLAWMLVLFVQTIQHSAINTVMQSIGPKQEQATAARYYSHMFLQQGVFGIATALISWIGVHFSTTIRPDWHIETFALPVAGAVLFCQTQDFFRRYLFSIRCERVGFLIDLVRYVGPMGMLIIYDQYGPGGINAPVAIWINALAAAIAVLCASSFIPRLRWGGAMLWGASRRSWQFSKWLVASSIVSWAMGNLFVVITSILLGTAAVGILRVASTLLGIMNIFFLGIENVLPIQSSRRLMEGGIIALNSYLKKVALLGGVATLIVAGVIAITSEFWLDLLFGKPYASAGTLVQWLALSQIFFYLTLPAMIWLRTVEQTHQIFYAYLGSSVASVVVAYPTISYFGLKGAAIGMLISTIVNFAILALAIQNAWSKIINQKAKERKWAKKTPEELEFNLEN